MEPNDLELLIAWQRDGDDPAFARLVERHRAWIFAAARRRLGDDHLADDATQAAFIVLASKAQELVASKRGSLSAWLFHVVHFTCARLRRTQSRLAAIEHIAADMRTRRGDGSVVTHSRLVLLMEESIAQLPAGDREMVVRRFYRRQSFAEVGKAMGITAEAARKRVMRSLAHVRAMMLRDGIDAIPDSLLSEFESMASVARVEKPAALRKRIQRVIKESKVMAEQQAPSQGGHQMISAEFLVRDVEANLEFFEKLGFPRRFIDKPDSSGKIPRASLTAGQMGKIWIRRATESEIHPSPSINVFFWINGGPDGLVAHRKKLAEIGVPVTEIIDEHGLPNFNVTTPDGYSVAFFTQYVPPDQPPVVLVK